MGIWCNISGAKAMKMPMIVELSQRLVTRRDQPGNPKPGQSDAGNGAQEATRKAHELANANSWNEILLVVRKALAAQPPKPMSKKILLVDDECSILEALSKVLRNEDYEVVPAENGKDAVEQIAAGPYRSGTTGPRFAGRRWVRDSRVAGENQSFVARHHHHPPFGAKGRWRKRPRGRTH